MHQVDKCQTIFRVGRIDFREGRITQARGGKALYGSSASIMAHASSMPMMHPNAVLNTFKNNVLRAWLLTVEKISGADCQTCAGAEKFWHTGTREAG